MQNSKPEYYLDNTIVAIVLLLIAIPFLNLPVIYAVLLYLGALMGSITLVLKIRRAIIYRFKLRLSTWYIIIPLMSLWMIYQVYTIIMDHIKEE